MKALTDRHSEREGLHAAELKTLKQYAKQSDANVEATFHLVWSRLKENHAKVSTYATEADDVRVASHASTHGRIPWAYSSLELPARAPGSADVHILCNIAHPIAAPIQLNAA